MTDKDYMRLAIEMARQGDRASKCSPIGCVLVLDGAVIAQAHNEVEHRCDPTAHAEILAMRQAGAHLHRSRFPGAVLYSTLQPCGMCSMASIWAGISRIVYGAERHQVHQMYFEDRDLDTVDFLRDAYKDDVQIEAGLLGEECAALYYGPQDDPPADEQANL
ncbi:MULTISPECIES: nucleoside deaminase [Acidiphilium]|uniref:tRNA(Adenine34) deaminase n=1 Tax=Acidiphilium rubrum TaxID=526 RepID=A0A8G2FE02_ACIRU|nr:MULTISPECIES: nucleoside deaminase [Acidiphilium]SIQ73117.1 tRNA(adenine34) deaminase [Acidiphilium rubrum]